MITVGSQPREDGGKDRVVLPQTKDAWDYQKLEGLPRWFSGKESACQCRRHRFNPWVGKIPWRMKWQPTPVFLPGEFHGQRNLAVYSPWGYKDSNVSEQL